MAILSSGCMCSQQFSAPNRPNAALITRRSQPSPSPNGSFDMRGLELAAIEKNLASLANDRLRHIAAPALALGIAHYKCDFICSGYLLQPLHLARLQFHAVGVILRYETHSLGGCGKPDKKGVAW